MLKQARKQRPQIDNSRDTENRTALNLIVPLLVLQFFDNPNRHASPVTIAEVYPRRATVSTVLHAFLRNGTSGGWFCDMRNWLRGCGHEGPSGWVTWERSFRLLPFPRR